MFIHARMAGNEKYRLWIATALIAAVLAGCGSVPEKRLPKVAYVPGEKVDLGNTALVKEHLYTQYGQWKNTKYRLGGLSRNGVDCSGFVYMTFRSRLGVVLPRSTEFQAELGESVDKSQLRPGDLVFFKTGITDRHVGIYLENGKFLHASSSQGVTISGLDENYWRSAYWKAKRLGI